MVDKEWILRKRMHGLYLSRKCEDIVQLSRELMGLHCWFHRNVAFSALIRGAGINGWEHALTKTWLYRGTLHGVAYDQLRCCWLCIQMFPLIGLWMRSVSGKLPKKCWP